jgi:pyruvate dehydrogenase complex dehydrogenase (E1) component
MEVLFSSETRNRIDGIHDVGDRTDQQIDVATLESIEDRLRWLSVRMIDHANRRSDAEIKVGGHQASSASMTSIMTALWFAHITGDDKVAVKPHAAPLFHAIKYLTGELDRSYLTKLRRRGGLQAYPSRTKDPDVSDFSTGSVGLGAVAPLFAAAARRYIDNHFERSPAARFIAIAGDAELDEGNVWEAISDPTLQGLGNVMLVIDLNRQSPDRLYKSWVSTLAEATRSARLPESSGHIGTLILPDERNAAIVTVHDGATHAMAWIGSVFGQRVVPIGVDRFGESGTIAELYEAFGLLPDQIATAGLIAVERDS